MNKKEREIVELKARLNKVLTQTHWLYDEEFAKTHWGYWTLDSSVGSLHLPPQSSIQPSSVVHSVVSNLVIGAEVLPKASQQAGDGPTKILQ